VTVNKIPKNYTVQAKTKEELKVLIESEIIENGNQCDLNHIDVSLITDFSNLFLDSVFNGDISRWNVSGAVNMRSMFDTSEFNGDISGWDISGVENMNCMFFGSAFNGDVSRWDVSGVINMRCMFYESEVESDVSSWRRSSVADDEHMFSHSRIAKKLDIENPSFDQIKSHFLNLKLEIDLQGASPGQNRTSKVRL